MSDLWSDDCYPVWLRWIFASLDNDSEVEEVQQPENEVSETALSVSDDKTQGDNYVITQIRDYFSEHLVEPYWLTDEGCSGCSVMSPDSDGSLASQWAQYTEESHPFGVLDTPQRLHEIQLVRETMWMLSGVKQLYIYTFVNERFDVCDTIELNHITKISLQRFLRKFADTATSIVELRSFIKDVSEQGTQRKTARTFQAFGYAVLCYLQKFNEQLSSLEELIIKKQEAVTLSMLYHNLSQSQKEIAEIYHVFADGIKNVENKENYEKVTRFLNVFYQNILLADGMGEYGRWKVELLLPTFLKSVEPYVEFLDGCLTEGKLIDDCDEFCIQRLPDIADQSPEIWTSALRIKGGTLSEENYSCPSFLQPVLQEIVLAGKSIILLESLGKLANNADLRLQEDILYQMFTQSVSNLRDTRSMAELFNDCFYPHIRAKYKKSCSFLIQLLKTEYMLLDHLAALRNFFLLEAGDAMHHFYCDIFRKCSRRERWQDMSYLNGLLQESLFPGYQMSRERLAVGYNKPSKIVTDSFEGLELNYKAPWPVDLIIDDNTQKKYNDVFLFLLHVKRAKWSLDCLRFRDLENKVIARESDNEEEDQLTKLQTLDTKTQHNLHLLRFDLMQFVNGLHQYIMTRILHSKLEFNEALSKASDLDEIIKAHGSYVEKVLERCLMTNKVEVMRVGILKVLKLAVKFNKLWTFNIRQNRDDMIHSISEDLKKWRTFIVTFLTKQIKQGSYVHLEALAFSLGASQKT